MQLCPSAQGNTNVIDLLDGGSGFYNMTIYSLGAASALFILLFSVHLNLFPLSAIGLNVPFLIAVMASKIAASVSGIEMFEFVPSVLDSWEGKFIGNLGVNT